MIMLAISKVKASDEGKYKLTIENCHGTDEAEFMLFVSGKIKIERILSANDFLLFFSLSKCEDDSGMDFRAMLKKKKYAKWGTDEDDPDWGNLKHVEDQVDGGLKKAERVRLTF